jgi:hypothetical protein
MERFKGYNLAAKCTFLLFVKEICFLGPEPYVVKRINGLNEDRN